LTIRIAVAVSHPIQHFAPQFRSWAKREDVELHVFFASSAGSVPYADHGFGRIIEWGASVTEGYSHTFVNDDSSSPRLLDRSLDGPAVEQMLDFFDPDVVLVFGHAHAFERRVRAWGINSNTLLAYISDSESRHRDSLIRTHGRRLFLRQYLKAFSIFLTVGDANETFYRSAGVSSGNFIRAGFPIDFELFDEAIAQRDELRESTRAHLGVASDDVVVLSVGKLIPRKRHIDLLNACVSLGADSKVRPVIVGSGPDMPQLDSFVAGSRFRHRVLAGFVAPDKLLSFYLAADIYVHPALVDPHPLSVSEALYAGLPLVVSSTIGSWGPTDEVQDGHNGFVYKCQDTSQLAQHLNRLAGSDTLRSRFGEESSRLGRGFQERAHTTVIDQLIGFLGS